jgi:lipid II:glycine glycyltransferase (peptidoglycan interpeptide bridge formation enzyme)
MPVELKILTPQDEKDWDNFVENHPLSRYSFLTGYKKAVEQSFGYEAKYWFIKKSGEIQGVFPSFLIKGHLISIPFAVYGGILSDNLSPDEISLALEEIKKKYKSMTIFGLEQKINCLTSNCLYQCGILTLNSAENLWQNKLDRAAKKNINKAQSFNLEAYVDNSEENLKNIFYPLYLKEMKRLGSPPYGLDFFLNTLRFLKDKVKIMYIKNSKNIILASLFGIGCGNYFYIAYNPSLPEFYFQRPNDYLHWEMIKQAYKDGYKYFDFGPMRYEGQIRFKEKWGVEPVNYYIYSNKKTRNPKQRNFKMISKGWKLFMPIWFSKKIGPWIRKKLVA